jgi:D-glycero-D-manno-heptose 1,7-bisphosphate phosphatase
MRNGVPVPTSDSDTNTAALRRTLRLPRSRRLILHVGELEARKGQETTLRALARLVDVRARPARDAPLLGFLGTGPDETRLRDVCHELGLQPYVSWIGFRKNVADYMRAADVVVLPTRREGLPWTLLEAMSHGVPVIASAVSGVPELVEDGETGLLVGPDDPDALARALRRVLDEPQLAARLRRNALRAVRRDWSREDMLHDLEALVYANLIRTQPPGGKRGAFFVDRDGTLIDNVPYNGKPEAVRLKPSVGRALRWVHEAGIPVVLVTNQSGVARGLHTLADVEAVNAQLTAQLEEQGVSLSGAYLCPHHPDFDSTCDCRKPEPGLLLRAARELDVALERSIMVGDNLRDLEAGRRAGAAAVVGYASDDSDSDLPQASRSRSWPRIVRDFLRAYWSEDWRHVRDDTQPAVEPSARKDEFA